MRFGPQQSPLLRSIDYPVSFRAPPLDDATCSSAQARRDEAQRDCLIHYGNQTFFPLFIRISCDTV